MKQAWGEDPVFRLDLKLDMPSRLPGDLPDPEIEPMFPVYPALQADSLPTEPSGKPYISRNFCYMISLTAITGLPP